MVICCGITLNKENYKYHFRMSHFYSPQSSVNCPECGKNLSRIDHLEAHFRRFHYESAKTFMDLPDIPQMSYGQVIDQLISNNITTATAALRQFNLPDYADHRIQTSRSNFQQSEDLNMPALNNSFIYDDRDENEINLEFLVNEPPQINSLTTDLNELQIDLLAGMNEIKDNNSASIKVIKETVLMTLNLMGKHLMNRTINGTILDDCKRVAHSDYYLKKSRSNNIRSNSIAHPNVGSCYYFSIQDTIRNFLSNKTIFELVMKERRKERNPEVIGSILDLDHVKALDSNLAENEVNLYFDLYYDDVNKSKRTSDNTNISVVFLSIGNLNYKFKSKRNSIGLIAITKKSIIKKISITKFFEPVKNEIKNLQPFDLNGIKFNLKFFKINSDNKGAHEMIVDICQSFNGQSCRRCETHCNQLKTQRNHVLKQVLPRLHVFYGCEHVTNLLYALDIFHDLNEGVIIKLMELLLQNLTPTEIEDLNERIQEHDQLLHLKLSSFRILKRDGKIVLKGTGIQKLTFFNIFSILNIYVRKDSPQFDLYFNLRKIVNFCLSDVVHRNELQDLDLTVKEFIEQFIRVFPNSSVTPKMHYMEHYSQAILEFGPLILASTLPFERVNQKIVRSVETSRNSIDLPLTIKNFFNFKLADYFDIKINEKFTNLNQVDEQFRNYISSIVNENQITSIIECEFLTFQNTKIERSKSYLLKYDRNDNSNLPLFVKIIKVFWVNDSVPILVGRLLKAINYDGDFLIYQFKFENSVVCFHPDHIHYKKLITFVNQDDDEERYFALETFHMIFN